MLPSLSVECVKKNHTSRYASNIWDIWNMDICCQYIAHPYMYLFVSGESVTEVALTPFCNLFSATIKERCCLLNYRSKVSEPTQHQIYTSEERVVKLQNQRFWQRYQSLIQSVIFYKIEQWFAMLSKVKQCFEIIIF